jgi:hypothetical protein
MLSGSDTIVSNIAPARTPKRRAWPVLAAIPGGSRRPRSPREWLTTAQAAIDEQGWYANRAAHTGAVVKILARYMDWRSKTAEPVHARICGLARISPDTAGRVIAWLQSAGLLGVVSPGRSAAMNRNVLRPDAGNERAVYVLCVPRLERGIAAGQRRFADPSPSRSEGGVAPRAREASTRVTSQVKGRMERPPGALSLLPHSGAGPPALPRGGDVAAKAWAACSRGEKRTWAVAVAGVLRSQWRPLRQLSERHIAQIIRPWLAAGWDARMLDHAIERHPGGGRYGYTSEPRHVSGWLRARLGPWMEDGQPMEAPDPVAAAAADREHLQSVLRDAQDATRRASEAERDRQRAARYEAAVGPLHKPPAGPEPPPADKRARFEERLRQIIAGRR